MNQWTMSKCHRVTVIKIKCILTTKKNQKAQIKKVRRNFHKGKNKDMKKYLSKLDWNNMLRNKTTIEFWNILKYEIESINYTYVPLNKQGKRYRKEQLS